MELGGSLGLRSRCFRVCKACLRRSNKYLSVSINWLVRDAGKKLSKLSNQGRRTKTFQQRYITL